MTDFIFKPSKTGHITRRTSKLISTYIGNDTISESKARGIIGKDNFDLARRLNILVEMDDYHHHDDLMPGPSDIGMGMDMEMDMEPDVATCCCSCPSCVNGCSCPPECECHDDYGEFDSMAAGECSYAMGEMGEMGEMGGMDEMGGCGCPDCPCGDDCDCRTMGCYECSPADDMGYDDYDSSRQPQQHRSAMGDAKYGMSDEC